MPVKIRASELDVGAQEQAQVAEQLGAGLPAIQRQVTLSEGMEEAAVMMVGLSPDRVLQGLSVLDREAAGLRSAPQAPVADYGAEDVSDKVVRILHSYTDYVNRVVWRKPAS